MANYGRPQVAERVQRRTAANLDEKILLCRMMRHVGWTEYTPSEEDLARASWGTPVGWKCSNCGTKRIDVIDANGNISWRKYIYPENYGIPKNETPQAWALRQAFVKRKKEAQKPVPTIARKTTKAVGRKKWKA